MPYLISLNDIIDWFYTQLIVYIRGLMQILIGLKDIPQKRPQRPHDSEFSEVGPFA